MASRRKPRTFVRSALPLPARVQAVGRLIAGRRDALAALTWTAPTTNTNGDSFDNSSNDRTLAGYRVYYGTTQSEVSLGTSSVVSVSAGVALPYVINNLTAGTWYFRVVAVDGDGDESNTGASATTYSKVTS